jgi:hypothetical protein
MTDHMTKRIAFGLASLGLAACGTDAVIAQTETRVMTALQASQMEIGGRLSVARFDEEDRLVYPEDVDAWVHVGSNLGLNYNEADFDPDSPGSFGVVTMEPTAYRYFMETGRFADGSMFHLTFHRVVRDLELSPDGFATGAALASEIHLKDSEMFPDGFNFFTFAPTQTAAAAVPLPNDCVACHMANAAYDGVFTQFYPAMNARLAQGAGE